MAKPQELLNATLQLADRKGGTEKNNTCLLYAFPYNSKGNVQGIRKSVAVFFLRGICK